MVQTRSVASKGKPGCVNDGNVVPLQDNTFEPELSPASDDDSPAPPTKKRRRDGPDASQKKKRRRKREELCQLNLDVLFLIAEYIHPMDLLNLARTCKSLRELLMDKSSEFVWKTARHQEAGLPDCPSDLTEPEYANLVFCARCHGCGKQARTVLWYLRRRYCPKCKSERLCRAYSCDAIFSDYRILPEEYFDKTRWVDKEQMELVLDEYRRSSNKQEFLQLRRTQYYQIHSHVRKCEIWQRTKASERRENLAFRRDEREKSILEKLKQHGYEPEIDYFGLYEIRSSNKATFRKSKPLTYEEWYLEWPKWRGIMDEFRSRRMDRVVYPLRLQLLENVYKIYVEHPTPDEPTFDFLPHVNNLTCFGPFRDVIMAPEETIVNDESFASAFTQLPDLIGEWRNELKIRLAELVKIPQLSPDSTSDGQDKTPSDTGHAHVSRTNLDKLHLACALFRVNGAGCFTHLSVLSVSMRNCGLKVYQPEWGGSIERDFCITFMEEAPYIVRVCGLDPAVATVDDMDRRNAQLRCLCCKSHANTLMDWRRAMWHVGTTYHRQSPPDLPSEPRRWELVSGKHINETQAIEQPVSREASDYVHCLLCRRHVGDALRLCDFTIDHFTESHGLSKEGLEEGVHYVHLGIRDFPPKRC